MQALLRGELPAPLQVGMATTIGVVATDAVLTKAQANKVAQMAHDGLARSINPVHTMTDGDTLFALATGASGLERQRDADRRAGRRSDGRGRAARRARRHGLERAGCSALAVCRRSVTLTTTTLRFSEHAP